MSAVYESIDALHLGTSMDMMEDKPYTAKKSAKQMIHISMK
jgi:hypothetical protein